jgi:peptidoglycan/xylan/chitin deacetylase (PgdA/CDA1 family)
MKHHSWILIPALALVAIGATFKLSQAQSATQPTVAVAVPKAEPARPAVQAEAPPAMQAQAPEQVVAGQKRLSYNSCNVEGPYIAITFDDGPHATLTPKLLDILKERGIKATFFVLGECVAANPDVLRRAVAEGHEIGNHSWDHKALPRSGGAGVAAEMSQTNAAIEQAGGKKPVVMRPPYGATTAAITKRLNEEFGFKVVLWDVDPLDWKVRNSAHVTSEILKNTKPGSIVLAHDIHPTTVAAMPETLDALLKKGFKFVTVSELIAMDRPLPAPTPQPAPTAKPASKKSKSAH